MRLRVILPVVLAVLLAVASAQNAFAFTELKYDDGTAEMLPGTGSQGLLVAVKFVLADFGISRSVIVVSASAFMSGYLAAALSGGSDWSGSQQPLVQASNGVASYRVHVFKGDGVTELFVSPVLTITGSHHWVTIDLSSFNIVVTGSFYVAIEWITNVWPSLGGDNNNPSHTYVKLPGGNWQPGPSGAMIRASVGSSVGGVVLPTNTLAVLTPYLAVIGLVAATAAVAIKKRKA